jgi:hypothetical protein
MNLVVSLTVGMQGLDRKFPSDAGARFAAQIQRTNESEALKGEADGNRKRHIETA